MQAHRKGVRDYAYDRQFGIYTEVVERLLAADADANVEADVKGGRMALQAAAEGGHLEVVETLLTAGADVNAKAAYYDGRTALQAAAKSGNLEVLKRLRINGRHRCERIP